MLTETASAASNRTMGFRVYKSVRLGKGVRLNLSRGGVGISAGVPGFRYSVHSSGRKTTTIGVPGSGVYYRTQKGGSPSGRSTHAARTPTAAPLPQVVMPHAGIFAPKDEKHFVKGVTAYIRGDYASALTSFNESMARDTTERHIAEEYFAAFSLLALNRIQETTAMLRKVLASPVTVPDALMTRYGVGGVAEIRVAPSVTATVPHSQLAAALLLAELSQHSGQPDEAIRVLESLGSLAPDPVFALSLADLYVELGRWDDAIRVTDGFFKNENDATAQLLVFRATSLRQKGLPGAAIEILREALKSKKRSGDILASARYERSLAYEATGKKARARQEWERLYAEDPHYRDVAQRLAPKQT